MSYIRELVSNRANQLIFLSVVSFATGALVAEAVARKELREYYAELSDREIAEAKAYYKKLMNVNTANDKTMSPSEILAAKFGEKHEDDTVEEARTAFNKYAGLAVVRPSEGEKAEPEWDYEIEAQIRAEAPDQPYIISFDEYFEGEKDYEQASMTYFEGDDTLCDDKDAAVPDVAEIIGEDCLIRFGHGSNDPNIVYVRNDRIEIDFAITRSGGKYTVEVLGFDDEDEIKHSHHRPGLRFRDTDE